MTFARANPFSSDRVLRTRYCFSAADWSGLIAKLACQHGRGALVGPKGSGKTTLLEDLATRLRQAGQRVTVIRLSSEFPSVPGSYNTKFFSSLNDGDAVMLDGAEQLSPLAWLRFRWRTRKAGFLIVTVHRAGRLPLLHRCTTSPELLRMLVSSLGQSLGADESAALFQRHHGNLREALRELYDLHAKNGSAPLSFPAMPG